MISVLLLAAVLWVGLGWAGLPRHVRAGILAVLFAAVIGAHLILPDGHILRQVSGGSAQSWAVLLGFGVLAALYARLVAGLKARALGGAAGSEPVRESVGAGAGDALSPEALRRYSRHIMLREIGGPGQMQLARAKVLVIGAGGLGAPVLLYLAAAGVGNIGVIDDDVVEESNLQRQVIHGTDWIGKPKVFSAQAAIAGLNPHVSVTPYHRRFDESCGDLVAGYDLVIDGCDSFATRSLVNRLCVAAKVPVLSGAISQWEGQVSLFDPGAGGPCYACVFPSAPAAGLAPSCAEAGVIGPLPGVIGAMMAVEAVKHLTGAGETLSGRMMIYDALYADHRDIKVARDPGCAVCG